MRWSSSKDLSGVVLDDLGCRTKTKFLEIYWDIYIYSIKQSQDDSSCVCDQAKM